MPKFRPIIYFHKLILVFLYVVLFNNENTCAQNSIANEIIYDTVFVYDTIWEYETVYDTVWEYETVFDTVFIDAEKDHFAFIEPITISQLQFSSNYYKKKSISKPQIKNTNPPAKRSIFSKIRFDIKKNREHFRSLNNWNAGSDIGMTLNPTKGTFDPRAFSRGTYSIDSYFGVGFQNKKYALKSDSDIILDVVETLDELPTLEMGLRFNYHLFQYGAQTGIGISQLRESFDYIETTYNVYSIPHDETFSRWQTYTVNDSAFNIDIWLQTGDSVWTPFEYSYDSLVYIDTVTYSYDSTAINLAKNELNTHTLIEIPLILTYEFGFPRVKMQFKLGVINQIHTFSSGVYKPSQGKANDINNYVNFTKYNIALYAGIGGVFKASMKWSLVIDAYYKQPLRSFGSTKHAVLSQNSFGINAGLRYSF